MNSNRTATMSNHPPQGSGNGPPSAGMGMQHQQGGQGPPPQAQTMSQQNLNQIVRILFCLNRIQRTFIPRAKVSMSFVLRFVVVVVGPTQFVPLGEHSASLLLPSWLENARIERAGSSSLQFNDRKKKF